MRASLTDRGDGLEGLFRQKSSRATPERGVSCGRCWSGGCSRTVARLRATGRTRCAARCAGSSAPGRRETARCRGEGKAVFFRIAPRAGTTPDARRSRLTARPLPRRRAPRRLRRAPCRSRTPRDRRLLRRGVLRPLARPRERRPVPPRPRLLAWLRRAARHDGTAVFICHRHAGRRAAGRALRTRHRRPAAGGRLRRDLRGVRGRPRRAD